jgi:glycosyltransferase involved in cell wall biosynthesis
MSFAPAVSVLVPSYNRAGRLAATLESIFAQSVPVAEVLVIDDGSQDETPELVEQLRVSKAAWKDRLRYLRQENQGKSVALNHGLRYARGDWIAFNDSDDVWFPDKLEWQFRALERFPDCGACFTETTLGEFRERCPEYRREAGDEIGRIDEPCWLFAEAEWPGIYMQTIVVRADVMKAVGTFDPRYRVSQDVDFLFRLGLVTPFCYVDRVLTDVYQDPNRALSLTANHPARSWPRMRAAESMLAKWLSMLDESRPQLSARVKHALASARSAAANRYVLAGEVKAARAELRKSLKDSPELRICAKWVLSYLSPSLLRRLAARRAPGEFFGIPETGRQH